jgi:hypothetical protein
VDLCLYLLRHHEHEEGSALLRQLSEQGNLEAIAHLAELTGTGGLGFEINLEESKLQLSRLTDKAKQEELLAVVAPYLCQLYQNPQFLLYSAEKTLAFCPMSYSTSEHSTAMQATDLMNEASPLYDPEEGLRLYQSCLESDPVCRTRFARQALYTPSLAQSVSTETLFTYAESASLTQKASDKTLLALFYLSGIGIPQNKEKAQELLQEARALDPMAIYTLISLRFFNEISLNERNGKDTLAALLSEYDYQTAQSEHFRLHPFRQWLQHNLQPPSSGASFESFLQTEANRGQMIDACVLAEHQIQMGLLKEAIPYANQCHQSRQADIHEWGDRLLGQIKIFKKQTAPK